VKRIEGSEVNLEPEGHFVPNVFRAVTMNINPSTLKTEAAGYTETSLYV
jgi:hypothetical protein